MYVLMYVYRYLRYSPGNRGRLHTYIHTYTHIYTYTCTLTCMPAVGKALQGCLPTCKSLM